ncbi:MAG: hypothetical protein MUF56_05985, partial [Solirubrobacteraceae bacterium]|nr:hypothetical protein [Solirubrobacteraceae bacterium]
MTNTDAVNPSEPGSVVFLNQTPGPTFGGGCSSLFNEFVDPAASWYCDFGSIAAGGSLQLTAALGPLAVGDIGVIVGLTQGGSVPWGSTVQPRARLAFDLSATPETVTVGNTTTIVAKLSNTGPGVAFSPRLSFTLPPGLVPASLPTGCVRSGLAVSCE